MVDMEEVFNKYPLLNSAREERIANTTALCSICSIMDFAGHNPNNFDVQSKRPEGISSGRWAAMVKRFWNENYT